MTLQISSFSARDAQVVPVVPRWLHEHLRSEEIGHWRAAGAHGNRTGEAGGGFAVHRGTEQGTGAERTRSRCCVGKRRGSLEAGTLSSGVRVEMLE